jgi:hypothetical protein
MKYRKDKMSSSTLSNEITFSNEITLEEFQNNTDGYARFRITDTNGREIECTLIKTNVNPDKTTFIIGDHVMMVNGEVVNSGKRNHIDAENIKKIQKL